MKKFRCFMQIAYSPNNALITVSCRLREGCERLHASSPELNIQHRSLQTVLHRNCSRWYPIWYPELWNRPKPLPSTKRTPANRMTCGRVEQGGFTSGRR